jgi:hypothetical protein
MVFRSDVKAVRNMELSDLSLALLRAKGKAQPIFLSTA